MSRIITSAATVVASLALMAAPAFALERPAPRLAGLVAPVDGAAPADACFVLEARADAPPGSSIVKLDVVLRPTCRSTGPREGEAVLVVDGRRMVTLPLPGSEPVSIRYAVERPATPGLHEIRVQLSLPAELPRTGKPGRLEGPVVRRPILSGDLTVLLAY